MNLSQLNRILQQMFWLPIMALLLVSTILVREISTGVRTVESIQLADHNIESVGNVTALVVDEETGIRGFQNTGEELFLQPYDHAGKLIGRAFSDLRVGIARTGGDLSVLNQAMEDHARWQTDIAIPLITAIRTGTNTHDIAVNLRGKASMDVLRSRLAIINGQQRQARDRAVARWQSQVRHTIEAVVGLSIVIGLMLGVYGRSQLHAVSAAFQNAVAALRRHGQQVHASEQRLRTILSSIGDAVVVCDIDGRVEMMNSVAEKLTGWPAADALQQPIDKVVRMLDEFSREVVTPAAELVRHHARSGHTASQQGVLQARSGAEINIDSSGSVVQDNTGRVTGMVLVFRDITEQRHTQAALLSSEKLAVAGRLAATIAHEIHNPLDAVINILYLLRTGSTAPHEQEELLNMASTELDRVAQISRAMLGMYRESKTPVALDVSELIHSLLLLLDSHLMQAQVATDIDLEPETIVTAYASELRQVFTNLITNALDASSPGKVVHISTHRTPPPNVPGVLVTIRDEGAGIPDDVMPHLFQPFFTTKGERGTGLGLWVSQGIIEKHGGWIHLKSGHEQQNQGTTVTVFLPRGEAPLLPAGPA